MLVVTANWWIGDGTVHGAPQRTIVASFLRDLHRAAWRAGFRRDGLYRPIDAAQIVLAGDTFDGLVSLEWQGDARPWRGGKRCRETADRIGASAIRQGAKLLASLRRLRRDGLTVPQADERGRPRVGSDRRVPVSICCLMGDRDRGLEGPRLAAAAARHGIGVGIEWSSESITVRHGSESDPLCGLPDAADGGGIPHGAVDRPPTLGESLAVDLVVDFARRLHRHAPPGRGGRALMRSVARAWPLDMPLVIAAAIQARPESGFVDVAQGFSLREAWLGAVEHWHARARASAPDVAAQPDVVDSLAAWLHEGIAAVADRPRWPAALGGILEPRSGAAKTTAAEARAATITVLGHPPLRTEADDGSAADGCICLGMPPLAGMPRAEPRDGPATVVFPHGPTAGWFPVDAVGMHGGAHQGIVARIGAVRDEPGIVDAA